MRVSVAPGRQGVIAFFVTFCVCLVALAVALNVGWVVLTLREIVPLLVGSLVFAAIITGLGRWYTVPPPISVPPAQPTANATAF